MAGTLILGAIVSIVLHRSRPSLVFRPFLGAGFCGALTTFSTVQVEAMRFARAGERRWRPATWWRASSAA